jgi:hypothetical protein
LGEGELAAMRYGGEVVRSGIGFGTALAMVVSFSLNKSVFWAILHGVFGWLYVVYYLIAY